ncbi:MAG: hypothetical protein IPL65_02695 [Lewinellaceae bacterium]|nr:hypothetical protein [Lewinellaceae bacterium]
MPKKLYPFLALCLLLVVACENSHPTTAVQPDSKQKKMARAFCECTATLQQLNLKATRLQQKTMPQDSVTAFFNSLQVEYNNTKTCLASAIAQYGKLKPEDLEGMQLQIRLECPAMADNRDFIREMLVE